MLFQPSFPCAKRLLGKVVFPFSILLISPQLCSGKSCLKIEYQMVGRLMYLSKLCSETIFKELPIPMKGCLYLIHVFNVSICESF